MAVTELLLPRTSDAMTEAVISRWLVPNESDVAKGDLVAEVETDKALVEVSAEGDGLLVAAVGEGSTVEVGAVLAYLLDGNEAGEYRAGRLTLGLPQAHPDSSAPASATMEPSAAAEAGSDQGFAPVAGGARPGGESQPVFSSPLARRMAREMGLRVEDLHPGTGPGGRVVRADVLRHAEATHTGGEAPASARQRSMVAAMVSSKTEIPHFYLFRDVDFGAVVSFRKALVAAELPAPSVSAFLIKALGDVLQENDFARRRWVGGQVQDSAATSVGIAVADGIDEIVVPVVQEPGHLSLEAIAAELVRLGDAVRTHALRREDTVGAVATISNLGMFGIDAMLPIIPPSQSFILGIGRDRQEVVLDHLGQVSSRTVATVGLAGDHRVLTGLAGARILEGLDQLLQHPLKLAMGGRKASTA